MVTHPRFPLSQLQLKVVSHAYTWHMSGETIVHNAIGHQRIKICQHDHIGQTAQTCVILKIQKTILFLAIV